MKVKDLIKGLLPLLILACVISCKYQNKKEVNNSAKKSIAQAISVLPNASIEETISYYHKLKKEQPNAYNFGDENELNTLGYQYLTNGKVEEAIEIFKLLVDEFPDSYNPYDSLGEAYYKNGNYELSLINYRNSLALNPKNTNAERMIFNINYDQRDRPKFYQVFSKQEYLEDMDEMAKRIAEKHPNPFEFITKEDFGKLVENQKAKVIEGMTYGEFIWELSPIIASVGCEHTRLGGFNQEDEMLPVSLRFPLEADLLDSELLVTNPRINGNKVAAGSAIKTINGKTINEITKDVFKHIPSNGYSKGLKKSIFSAYLTSYIAYYFGFPKSYEITLEGQNQTIKLTQLKEFEYPYIQDDIGLETFETQNYGILRIPYFGAYGGDKLKKYQKFIRSSFEELKRKKIGNLIIDLRGNGGGCSCGAIYLLQHIAKQPFIYFDELSPLPGDPNEGEEKKPLKNSFTGNTYILIDGLNASTSGHLLSVVKENNMAVLVGEEAGSSYYSNGGMVSHMGTHTAVTYMIASETYFTSATGLPRDRGVLPDHYVYKSAQDILNNKDAQMHYVLNIIKEK